MRKRWKQYCTKCQEYRLFSKMFGCEECERKRLLEERDNIDLLNYAATRLGG